MARLGSGEPHDRSTSDEMNDEVKQAIVAAEDQTFWTNKGVDFTGVMRAAWNNFTGGQTQGASTLTQQYARQAMDLKGATYSRKLREAVIAWKLDDKYSKKDILGFYLNTVPFGRGTHGVEAAAQAFFGKTVERRAGRPSRSPSPRRCCWSRSSSSPSPTRTTRPAIPGYDPTSGPVAKQNATDRWDYVRGGMVELGYLNQAQADALAFPTTVCRTTRRRRPPIWTRPPVWSSSTRSPSCGSRPCSRASPRATSKTAASRSSPRSTSGPRTPRSRRPTSRTRRHAGDRPGPTGGLAGRALVAIQPGTGRVLAYFGGQRQGAGADYAGWYYDEDGGRPATAPTRPGSTFKVYDLVHRAQEGDLANSYWDSPPTDEGVPGGGPDQGQLGPIHNAGPTTCTPVCPLCKAAVEVAEHSVLRPDPAPRRGQRAGHRPRRRDRLHEGRARTSARPAHGRHRRTMVPEHLRHRAGHRPVRRSRCSTTPTAWPPSPPAGSGPRRIS